MLPQARPAISGRRYGAPDTDEWRYLGLVIQPDGLYLREWDKDEVTELGVVGVDIPHGQWHDLTIEIGGPQGGSQENGTTVTVKHLRSGADETDSFEAETTIPGGGRIGFGVGSEADFRFDDVGTREDVTLTASTALRYHYDANGRVVGRTLDPEGTPESQFFIYDGDRIIQELDEGGNLVAAWDYGIYIDEIFVMYRDVDDNGSLEPYYYLQDDHYNVIGLTDANGTVVERYAYDDYGAPTIYNGDGTATRTESDYGNPFLFQGRRWDEVLSLYDYRTRYYDPALGRFLRIDTIGLWGDANNLGNPYAFVGNNPWSRLDPYGEAGDSFESDKAMLGGGGMSRLNTAKGHPIFQAPIGAAQFTQQDIHTALGGLGMVPVVGIVFDVADGTWYALEGNAFEASQSLVSAIPAVGQVVKVGGAVVGGVVTIVAAKEVYHKGRQLKIFGAVRSGAGAAPAKPGWFKRGLDWVRGKKPETWRKADGSIIWPPNRGFDGVTERVTLSPGTKIDRYGTEKGTFVSPEGVPFPQRALPPEVEGSPYRVYEVVRPIDATGGKTAAWFDQPGGGIQYELDNNIEGPASDLWV